MKKYIFGAVMFLASLMALPAFAQTADDYGTAATGTYCPVLSITMQRGARDVSYRGQVSELQKFISDYYDINPEKIVTGFFGRLTQEYVQQFQREQKLPTFGITGSMTRAAIAKVCGGISTNQSSTNTQNNVLNTNATSNTQTSSSLQNVSVQDFITGHNIAAADRINLVFVGINFASLDEFKTAITRELGWSGTPDKNGDFGPFAIEPLRSNKNKFNVWYDPTMITGATTVDDINEQIVQISNSKFNGNGTIAKLLPYTVPVYLNKLQTHADGTDTRIVHHADGYGITLSNNSFSSLAKSELHPRTVLITIAGLPHEPSTLAHEFGHSIFGLEDEKTHDEFDLPGVVPRSRAPNCVATMADAQALWGDMVGQVDPFYTEWKQITTRQPSAHMDEGMKVGYYYGKCYGDTNGKNVIRPTKYSIMNENTQTVAFGSVNRRQIETVLGFFSGSTAPIIATPHITRISSSIGTTGPSVTINGSGFTPTDNTLYIDGYSSTASYLWTIGTYPAVSNGNSIIFTLPSYQSPVCGLGGSLLMGCPAPSPIDPGTHTLTVKNANGVSNEASVMISTCAPGSAWNGSSCVAPIADATITVDGTAISNNAIITIPAGVSKTLVWNSNVGTTCGLNGKRWGSAVPSSGSMQLSGASADSYTFNCKGMNSFNFTVVADTVAITSVPTITAPTVTSITQTTAMLGASVVSLGNPAAVDGRGICWGTTPSPTNCAYPMWQEKQQLGAFAQLITSLTPGITYYYRGYATNVTGRGYSSDSTFTTLPCAPGSAWNGSSCVGVPAPTPTPEPTPTPTQAPVITADSTAIPNGGTVTIPTRGSVTLRFKDGCTFRPGLLSSSGTYDSLSKMHSWSINEQSVGSYTIDCSGMDPLNFTIVIAPPMAFGNSANQTASVLGAFNSVTSSNSPQSQGTNNFHYVWNRYLQIGSAYPDDIIALQTALAREGVYTGEKTGGFYNQTFVAVKSFQQKYGIEATGFVGSATRSKLNALYSE